VRARSASRRYIWLGGQLVELPSGPAGFVSSPFLSTRGKLRLLTEPLRGRRPGTDPEESVSTFFARRLGPEASRVLAGSFVSGVYAGDPDALEVRAAFPRLARWESESGSLLLGALRERRRLTEEERAMRRSGTWSFPGSVTELADRCSRILGERVRLGAGVREVVRDGAEAWRVFAGGEQRRCRRIVLAVPPPEGARLLRALDARAAELASGVRMAPVALVHLGGAMLEAERRPEGFGALVPRESGLDVLGIVFTSSLFPDRAPQGAWLQATFLGGVTNAALLERDDATLRRLAAEQTRTVLGFDPDRGLARVIRHRAAIPQLERGHVRRVAELRGRVAALGGLALAGNWLEGVSLDHAVASGRVAASHVAA
jgi:oxygen-dependent protoporphyrinogen oxidase